MVKEATTKKRVVRKNARAATPTRNTNLNIKKADNGGYVITSYNDRTGKDTTLIAKTPVDRNAFVKKLLGNT